MKKLFNYVLISVLMAGVFSACSSDDDKNPSKPSVEIESPEVNFKEVSEAEAKAEIAKISATLASMNFEVSDFAAQFASATIGVNTDEFTVFAIEDSRDESYDDSEGVDISRSVKLAKGNKINMLHHIIAGKPNFVTVTADKNYVYKTINGTELVISKRNNVIYVNGVAMSKNEFYGNHKGQSHIYCIKEELPEEKVSVSTIEGAFDIRVLNAEVGNVKSPYSPSIDAFVMFYEKVGNNYKFITKVRSNTDGYATLFYEGKNDIYYKAANRGYNFLYKGFQIAGIYADQKAVDNALPHDIKGPLFQPAVGGVIFTDLNKDGKISYEDKKGTKLLRLNKDADSNTIYLVNPSKYNF